MALHGTDGRHRIYLMRHGEVRYFDDAGRPVDPRHVELTARGRAQAGAAAAALAEVPIDRCVCSGLPRTRQTAEIAIGARALAIEEVADLGEIRGGRFADIPRERIEAELVYGFEGRRPAGRALRRRRADRRLRAPGGGRLARPARCTRLDQPAHRRP